ncbi:MAG: Trk system potassium transporter TrkA [Actinomycetes bacterium]|jgi:trk system potassium uptake protein TrkA|nr:MAG: Trk system potassium transporter TrkA [Actinomycetota bacterium]
MRIIVVGAGAVGSYLAERLSAEPDLEVVVIESDETVASQLQNELDALVVNGNGSSLHTLEEAGARHTDLLIAVTSSDGANVLACHAATELGIPTTIARIEDPDMREGVDRLGVDIIIDPSAAAAKELTELVGAGGVSELIPFANGKLVMVGGLVAPGAPLTRATLDVLRMRTAEWGWVVAAIVRDGRTVVGKGDLRIRAGDYALVMTTKDRIPDASRLIGVRKHDFRRMVIFGATRLAALTADLLERQGFDVVFVDEDAERCRRLSQEHPYALVISGDPTDPEVLADVEMSRSDVVLALTGWDEVNVLGCLTAKALGAGMTIARFNRIPYVKLLSGVGIDAAISSRIMAANAILRYVRQGKVEQVATFSNTDAEAIEIVVDAGSPAVGRAVVDLGLPEGVVIGGISRNETTFVPDGSSVIREGDHIIYFAMPDVIDESSAIFSA